MKKDIMTFNQLVASIRRAHEELAAQAGRAVNISLTLRNWMIGFHIAEFELHGADRAEYGEALLDALSERLSQAGLDGVAARSLRLYRQFYFIYPQIRQTVSAKSWLPSLSNAIWQSLSAKSGEVGRVNRKAECTKNINV
jgi:hypothetical protein